MSFEKRSKANDRPQTKKMNPEIDSDDDFEDPISTLKKVNKNRKRRIVEESSEEDDFVKPLPKKKKDDRKSKIETKKPSKKVEPPRTETRAFFEYSNEAILLRCQPNSYMDTVRKFAKKNRLMR
ncbi:hypothetical protein HanPI659440_Chr09g0315561 [Helianthus annuus]|nr:hypothetical protein HanPI659440_Chr09g0315561 [Helianthus annuus]